MPQSWAATLSATLISISCVAGLTYVLVAKLVSPPWWAVLGSYTLIALPAGMQREALSAALRLLPGRTGK